MTLGAIPAATPHTRPTPVFATASREGLLRPGTPQGPDGLLRVPAAGISVLEMSVIEGGIPSVGFYAQVPPYVGGPYAPATIALLEAMGEHLGITLPLGGLPEEATTQRAALDAAVAAQDDTRAMVEQLESQEGDDDEAIPSGDELASEIERYLRGQDEIAPLAGGRGVGCEGQPRTVLASPSARRRGGEAGRIPALSRNCRCDGPTARAHEPGRPARRTG